MENKVEKIMAILRDEMNIETCCYKRALEAYKKTYNPIKKYRHKKAMDMFGAHVAELSFILHIIKRELKD